jgi:hypothetical protein
LQGSGLSIISAAERLKVETAMIKFRRALSVCLAISLLALAGCQSKLPPPNSKPADGDDPSSFSAHVERPNLRSQS